jgi:hypothetical protein
MQVEEPLGKVDAIIRIDPDQVSVEGGVVDLRERQPVRDDRLTELLICIDDDMSGIEESGLR